MDELLTVREVAEGLKLNQQTIRNWIDQGKLPAHRLGRGVRSGETILKRWSGDTPLEAKPEGRPKVAI
jgi:excisionase family DNA binding protein